jgi:hypothetical protein
MCNNLWNILVVPFRPLYKLDITRNQMAKTWHVQTIFGGSFPYGISTKSANNGIQNYWVFEFCPSSSILKIREHNASETASVSILM